MISRFYLILFCFTLTLAVSASPAATLFELSPSASDEGSITRMIKRHRQSHGRHHQASKSASSKSSTSTAKKTSSKKTSSKKTSSKKTSSKKTSSKSSSKSTSKSSSSKGKTSVAKDSGKVGGVPTFTPPANLKQLAQSVQSKGTCPHNFSNGVKFSETGGFDTKYCGTSSKGSKLVYWMANMDVDCDGSETCKDDQDFQNQLAFEADGGPFNANETPYVVANQDSKFNFESTGLKGFGTVAVLCGKNFEKLVWATIADTNPFGQAGEGSIALAKACFGNGENGNNAAAGNVLYVGFVGSTIQSGSASAIASHGNSLMGDLTSAVSDILKL